MTKQWGLGDVWSLTAEQVALWDEVFCSPVVRSVEPDFYSKSIPEMLKEQES